MIFHKHQFPRAGKLRFRLRHLFAAVAFTAIALGLFIHFSQKPAAPRLDQGDFDPQMQMKR
jgi:hypothetical protein